MASFEDITVDVRVTPSVDLDHMMMVAALLKPGQEVLDSLTPIKCDICHAAVGISGEAGELLDAIKKFIFYDKLIDVINVIEELGDLEFYMQALRSKLGITREETLKKNMEKLAVRYKNLKYSDKAAEERADKA